MLNKAEEQQYSAYEKFHWGKIIFGLYDLFSLKNDVKLLDRKLNHYYLILFIYLFIFCLFETRLQVQWVVSRDIPNSLVELAVITVCANEDFQQARQSVC